MFKFLLIFLAFFLLARPLMRLALGYFVRKGVQNMNPEGTGSRSSGKPQKPEGTVTIEKANSRQTSSEFTEFEEVD